MPLKEAKDAQKQRAQQVGLRAGYEMTIWNWLECAGGTKMSDDS